MVFCVREIEALRLLGWCQYIRPAQLLRVVSETELSNLLTMKLIKYHSKSEALILTAEGRRLLTGNIWLPDTPRTYHADAVVRRLRLASLLLTAYQSGVNVYATQPDELAEGNALFLTSAGRGRGRNPWGSTRTAALLHGGEDPVPEMIKSAKRLESIGADFLIMPCNTAHNYYEQVCEAVTIPVLHMIALTRDALKARGVKCAGLLATDGTVQTGIYQRTFEQSGVALLTPDSAADQAAVMDVIYNGVKAGDLTHNVAAFRAACEHLLARGAEVLILGCTELPPAFELYHLDYPNVDPTLELALGAIRAAGCETK